MKYWLLLAISAVGRVLSLHVNEGCEAKSKWKLDYKWDEVKIGFWVPPEDTSRVLSIDVEFEGQIHPVTYDNIEIHRNEIQFTRIREGDRNSTAFQIFNEIADGWNSFDFTLDTQYSLRDMLNNSVPSLNSPVDYMPKSLRISGGYITVNCPSDLRMWKIDDKPVTLPLHATEHHWLSFYSNREFLPSMVIEKREFPLGWHNGTRELTTIPTRANPLPAFVQHHLMISCHREAETICSVDVQIGEVRKLTEELRVADIPKSVTVMKKEGAPFSILLHERDPFSVVTPEEPEQGNGTSRCNFAETWTWILAAIVSVLIVIILAVILSAYGMPIKVCVSKMLNKWNARRNDVENNHYTDEETSGRISSSRYDEAFIK